MAVKIRLKRMGAKKKPFYRVVVADSRSPRDGRFIEELGWVDPLKDPVEMKIDIEAARRWIGNGAQPTETARALLKKAGAYDAPEVDEAEETAVDSPVESANEAVEEVAAEEPVSDTAATANEAVEEVVSEEPVSDEAATANEAVEEAASEEPVSDTAVEAATDGTVAYEPADGDDSGEKGEG
jgi:small subunit ribosomal protein S16